MHPSWRRCSCETMQQALFYDHSPEDGSCAILSFRVAACLARFRSPLSAYFYLLVMVRFKTHRYYDVESIIAVVHATTKKKGRTYIFGRAYIAQSLKKMMDDNMSAGQLRQRYHRGGTANDDELTATQLKARYGIASNTKGITTFERMNFEGIFQAFFS